MKEETKEKAKSVMAKVKGIFDRGINASKKALGVAGEAVQDFSDKSVLRIEKKQLEGKLKKQYELLGEYACDFYLQKRTSSLSIKDESVARILLEVKRIKAEIETRELSLAEDDNFEKKAENKKVVAKAPAKTATKTATKAATKTTTKTTTKAAVKKTTSKK